MRNLNAQLYANRPDETLFHYTSLQGLSGIVESGAIWASDVRYLNDSAEIRHTTELILEQSHRRIDEGSGNVALLAQFQEWLSRGISRDHLLLGASFRANGNLLSQWRGYSSLGKGVSLGFRPDTLIKAATEQGFRIGRCIYAPEQQRQLIEALLDNLEQLAEDNHGGDYEALFRSAEEDLLHTAALLKHPAFAEEAEWRLVTSIAAEGSHPGLKFREGRSMLVPYVELQLAGPGQPLPLDQVYLGPTPHAALSMQSLGLYLQRRGIEPPAGILYCKIPYRGR
ncbi:DUF2971 domain-containing protein [Motiliproteus sediminis]|uniref:DUF2971 domain-containing protein n=1 Tax=Motiliproteus sediminis TaxID=1468178 RepID=UPI001AEF8A65|nr:DUF2971 domain-containing protein [Motiliproteus sediminis]